LQCYWFQMLQSLPRLLVPSSASTSNRTEQNTISNFKLQIGIRRLID
jgi:hypothetical protein